jgi:hypothetical protein
MNGPAASMGDILASLQQATGNQVENYHHPAVQVIKTLSAMAGPVSPPQAD